MVPWQSIRRRHLGEWTLGYLAAAWLTIQVLDILTDWYGFAPWLPRAAPILLVSGLLATWLVAWHHGERGGQPIRRSEVVSLTVLALVTAGATYAVSSVDHRAPEQSEMASTEEAVAYPTIAVLPFESLGAPPGWDHFAAGLTDELIGVLSRIDGLRVAGGSVSSPLRTGADSYTEIARQLQVRYLLEGSVRLSEDRLRVSGRLIDSSTGHSVWSNQYNRQMEDVLALQEEIARAIVNALGVRLLNDSTGLVRSYTEDLSAYREYLRGRALQGQIAGGGAERIALESIEAFRAALGHDPGYALAWSGMADTYAHYLADTYWPPDTAYALAGAAAERAVELDPTLGEARASLGGVLFWNGWDPEAALRELDLATELSPRYQRAHWIRGLVLHALGRYVEGREAMQRAAALDPSPYWQLWADGLNYSIRPPDEILTRMRDSLVALAAARPIDSGTAENLRTADYLIGSYDSFLRTIEEQGLPAAQVAGARPSNRNVAITVALARTGQVDEARGILEAWESLARERYVAAYFLAAVASNLSPSEAAFAWFDRAVADRDANLVVWLDIDPALDPVREDPRFRALRSITGRLRR